MRFRGTTLLGVRSCLVLGRSWLLHAFVVSLAVVPTYKAFAQAGLSGTKEPLSQALVRLQELPEDSAAERLDLAESILERARPAGDTTIEAEAHVIRGAALLKLARYPEAIGAFEAGRELARGLGEGGVICDSLRGQATVSFYLGEFDQTVALAREGLQLAEAPELSHKAWRLTNLLAAVHLRQGHLSGALELYLQALAQQEELGNAEVEASILNNLSGVYMQMAEYGKAIKALERCRAIMEELGNREYLADTLGNIGTGYRQWAEAEEIGTAGRREKLEEARSYQEQALEFRLELQMDEKIALSHHSLGRTLQALGRLKVAREHLEQSLALNRELGLRPRIAGVLAPLASLFIDLGQDDQAIAAAGEGAALSQDLGMHSTWLENLQRLAEAHENRGDYQAAVIALRQAWEVSQEINDEAHSRKLVEVRTQLEVREKVRQIELLTKDNELKTLAVQQQRNTRWALVIGFTFLILLLLLLINRFRLESKQALMLETVKQERATSVRLREIDQLKDEFLATTSHELRTPLDGITGLAESLIDGAAGELPQEAKANLGLITTSGRRLSAMVDDILDFSKLHRHGLQLAMQPVGLHTLADVVLTLSRPLAEGKNLELIAKVDPSLPLARADENRVQQILLNLVGNAIKFTDSGQVVISARCEDQELVVWVADTGIDIAADELEQIFQPFEQADSSIGRDIRGTGLGLSVSRQLVELHGGRIWAESEPDRGSTFYFTLPIASEEVAKEAGDDDQRELPALIEVARIPAEGKAEEDPEGGAAILVVDDEPVILQVLANHLAPEGYRLLQASSGREALAVLAKESVDIVLLDVMMPQMSGYEVCRHIRGQHQIEELPVLFLTAKTRGSDRAAGFREGANDYLSKPIARDELLARVSTHLKLARLHRSRVEEVKVLRGMLPICCVCKKIRDDGGYWNHLETYIDQHSEASLSHGICPTCLEEHYQTPSAE